MCRIGDSGTPAATAVTQWGPKFGLHMRARNAMHAALQPGHIDRHCLLRSSVANYSHMLCVCGVHSNYTDADRQPHYLVDAIGKEDLSHTDVDYVSE